MSGPETTQRQKFFITQHAYKRYAERCDLKIKLNNLAGDAFSLGRNLTYKEYRRFFKNSLLKDNSFLNHYRIYRDLVFVFTPGRKKYVLLTLFPLK